MPGLGIPDRVIRGIVAARRVAVALVAVALLPAGAVWAAPEPPAPAAAELVPGVYQSGPVDTPDQVLAPQVYQPSCGGQAFHAVYDTIHTTVGSMGCVNLRLGDARELWDVLKAGDEMYVWGRRPGA